MNPGHGMLKALQMIGLAMTLGLSVSACSESSWKEEVLLHDGSKIIVTRSQSRGGRGEIGQSPIKEQAITFTLPDSNKTIIWKDEYSEDVGRSNFTVLALHILDGTPYIVAAAPLCLAYNKWGRPNPPYIIFRYNENTWKRIALSEFPLVFKELNLVHNNSSHEEKLVKETRQSGFVSVASIKELNSSMVQTEYKSIVREPIKHEGPEGCPVMVRIEGGWQSPGGYKAPIPIATPNANDKK